MRLRSLFSYTPTLFTLGLPVLALLLLTSCQSAPENRDPTGEVFPSVQGTALDDTTVQLPEDLGDRYTVLLVGYVMEAQFDCDRWILGLMQDETPADLYEVPTIKGMLPGMFSGFIDDGMRKGIPQEDWGSVVTVYDDADAIVRLTGNDGSRNARVLLLDEEGRVVWFHDRGYSARALLEMSRLVRDGALP
jgi:hypothetical protein